MAPTLLNFPPKNCIQLKAPVKPIQTNHVIRHAAGRRWSGRAWVTIFKYLACVKLRKQINQKFKSNINTFLTKLRRWIKYVPNFPTHLHRAQGAPERIRPAAEEAWLARWRIIQWRPDHLAADPPFRVPRNSFSIQISRTKSNNKKSTEMNKLMQTSQECSGTKGFHWRWLQVRANEWNNFLKKVKRVNYSNDPYRNKLPTRREENFESRAGLPVGCRVR